MQHSGTSETYAGSEAKAKHRMTTKSQCPRPNHTPGNTDESYTGSSKSTKKRIRTPHPHDVLSGRGGGINSHPGNKTFREWVQVRKEDYNLAGSKADKSKVANDVMDLVRHQSPPGRFLKRANNSVAGPSWWVEVDEERALAKTSQALREGAPKIRAEHRDELHKRVQLARKTRKRRKSASAKGLQSSSKRRIGNHQQEQPTIPSSTARLTPPSNISMVPALDKAILKLSAATSVMGGTSFIPERGQDTFTLESRSAEKRTIPVPISPTYRRIFGDINNGNNNNNFKVDASVELPSLFSAPEITKVNSCSDSGPASLDTLDLSEIGGEIVDGTEEFVNPFANESEVYNQGFNPSPRQLLRNISSEEDQDKPGNDNTMNSCNNVLGGRQKSSLGGINTRYVSNKFNPKPSFVGASPASNCFCDCALATSEEGKSCICSDLADHFLHREGLSFLLEDDFA